MNDDGRNSGPGASRRELLKAFAIAGAGALLPARELDAQANPRRIDVHHHFRTDFIPGDPWTPELSIQHMDKWGVETAMLSHPGGGDDIYDGTQKGRDLARRVNDYGAKIASTNRKRFGLFAALPMRDVEGTLKEIEYALDTLKADGFQILSNTGEKWPGDPTYLPIFQELNRRKASVFIHPFVNKCCRNLVAGVNDAVIEFDFDTTRAVTSLLYNGVLSSCPDVRVIVNHSGAAVPALAGRIKDRVPGAGTSNFGRNGNNNEGKNAKIPNGTFYELRKLYYECAHAAYTMPMAALLDFVPSTQLLFGTDFPREPMESTMNELPKNKIPAAVMRALNRENAERLYPRLKA